MTETTQSRSTFLALLALSDGPKHGYDIATWVQERSGGFFSLSFGALYPVLHRLEREGLVKGLWTDGQGKRKKVYALTAAGKRMLQAERGRYEQAALAFARLLGSER